MSGGRRREETVTPHPPPHAQQPLVANGGGALRGSLWGRALRSDSAWEDKDEFLDVIYWFRQIIAVILGVIWGVVPLKGFVGIAILAVMLVISCAFNYQFLPTGPQIRALLAARDGGNLRFGFCLINAGVLYLYFSSFQQIDEEEYGGTWELTKEGFMTSFALFLVVWIIFYTAIHYD